MSGRTSSAFEARPSPSQAISEALNRVVVHQPRSLHECVTDSRADEVEAAFLQILAHRVRFRSARRNSLPQPPGVHSRFAADKLPDVAVERSKLPLHLEKCLGVLYCRSHLQPVADDPLVAGHTVRFSPVVAGDYIRVEPIKSRTIVFALPQNRVPAEPGLCAFQN